MSIKYFLKRTINIKNSYLIIILLVSILFIGLYFSYAILTTEQVKRGALNIAVGNLYPYIESEAFNEQSQVTVEAGSTKEITILLRNVNTIKTNLNLYYSSTSDLTNVSVRYIAGNSDVPPPGTGEVIDTSEDGNAERTYYIKIDNSSASSVTLTFGSSAGLVGRDLVLAEGCYAIEKVAQTVEIQDNMVRVVYDEGSSSWKKSDEENWYDYDNQKWANAVTINNKKVVDSSNNGNTATIVNSTYSKIDDREAVVLDGSSSYIDTGLANVDLGSTWGVGLTFSFNNILNNGTHALYGNWEGGGGGLEYVKTDTESYIHMSIYNLNSKSYEITKVSFDIEVGKIYTVIGWIINDEIYLYIEDVGFSSKPTSTTFTYNPTTVNVAIGANPGASLSGYSNITVYDAALYNASGASSFGSDSTYLDNNIDKMFDKNSVGSMVHALYNFRRDNNLSDNTLIPMDVVDTMWVYIPRYSYTIGSEDGTNYYGKQGEYLSSTPTLELPGEVDVKFIGKDVKEKGSAKYIVSEGVSGWYTPDAFTFGDKELSGIWIGKFETSSSNPTATDGGGNVTTLAPMIKPNVTSWRRINHANFETVAFNMTASNNIYGFVSENVDIHASKSSEWATAVYLSQSKYGKLGNTSYTGANKEVYMNNFQYKTGCSSGVPSAESSTTCTAEYNNITDRGSGTGASGAGASTTGTIYGIYDMNGGAWDMTMSNYNKYSGATQTENSGYTGKVSSDDSTFTGIAFPDDKYYDLYTTSDVSTACGGKVCLSYAMSETTGWYNDFSFMVGVDTHVWQTRGGHAINPKNSGIFAYSYAGTYWAGATYRLILSPLK